MDRLSDDVYRWAVPLILVMLDVYPERALRCLRNVNTEVFRFFIHIRVERDVGSLLAHG
jgi:hypothetical protein